MPISPDARWAALDDEQKAAALAAAAGQLHVVPDPEPTVVEDDGFAELDDFYDDTLKLRHGGYDYTLRAADIELGLLCQRIVQAETGLLTGRNFAQREVRLGEQVEQVLDDDTEEALYVRLLGGDRDHPSYDPAYDVWRQLSDQHAAYRLVAHMGQTALIWAAYDRNRALTYWRSGGIAPKAPAPTPKAPQDRKRKGGANKTH